MMTETKTFDDGWYGVFPEGGCYLAYEMRGGKVVDCISESEAGTHRNGSSYPYVNVHDAIYDMDEDDLGEQFESEEEHDAFVALLDNDWEPSCVSVCKLSI